MRRFFSNALTLALLISASHVAAAKQTLNFLTWSEYIDPEIVTAFEKKYNAKINFTYFEDDDDRDAILVKSDGKGFDLAIINGIQLTTYKRRGWLSKINPKEMPNIQFIDPKWRKAFEEAKEYSVPYFWGTTGIAYRKDLVKEPITSWNQLFHPEEYMKGRIVMLGVSRDVIGMALKSMGLSANSTDMQALQKVEDILKKQKPFVRTYAYMTLDKNSPLVTGDAVIAMAFSGDALMVKEHNENIEYVLPREGGNLWVDSIVIPSAAKNKELAKKFINFINSGSNAAKNAEYVHYATPNTAAEKRLPREFLADPVIYPSKLELGKSEFDRDLPIRIIKKRNQIMAGILHK